MPIKHDPQRHDRLKRDIAFILSYNVHHNAMSVQFSFLIHRYPPVSPRRELWSFQVFSLISSSRVKLLPSKKHEHVTSPQADTALLDVILGSFITYK